jgi:hypothetical protein
MRHLPGQGRLGEVLGHDAAEGVEDVLLVVGG